MSDNSAEDLVSEAAIEAALDQALADLKSAADLADLKNIRLRLTGEQAPLTQANRAIGLLPGKAKAEAGKQVGAARKALQQAMTQRQDELVAARDAAVLLAERVDVTLPAQRKPMGGRHPITALSDYLADVFIAMGYDVAEGPEIESEWFNFDALNIAPDHPARTMQDTFFVEPASRHQVLRTHTSPTQIHALLNRDLPVYVVCPGQVYRTDELDATHTPAFHQIEGLAVDKGITMRDLKGTLDHFAHTVFGADIRTRLRPSYFPFTEPSAEMDFECFVCKGESVNNPDRPCRTCKSEGWIEWGGCGMVNPRVLRACGVDPDVYSGFAFGMGIERTLMLRHGVTDMHDIVEGDVRFTTAFGLDVA